MSTFSKSYGNKNHFQSCLDLSSLSLSKIANVLTIWVSRSRQRHALSELDDHQLKDIGLDRAQVKQEIVKPFWYE